MKNLLLLFTATLLLTFASAVATEESTYEGPTLSYSVEKETGKVFISLSTENPAQYNEIKIVRSDNAVKYFRQIKALSGSSLENLTGADVIVDKFPLPSSQNAFYKIVTIDAAGVQKSYPSVKLAKL